MLNETNRRLLRHLLDAPTNTLAELASRVGVTTAVAARRLDKLSAQGVIRGQHAVIDWKALGYTVEVSLRFTIDKTESRGFDDFLKEARKVPEVVEIQTFLGRVDVRLSVIARDIAHYQEIYRRRILTLPHISDIEALMQVATIKSANALPL
jgi:Lrp/AsnC family transcriptional regulator